MDLSMDVDIHGSYLSNTSTWMWSVLSMDIQLDIHPLPSLVGRSVRVWSSVDHPQVHRFRSRNLVVSRVKLVRICAGNGRACTCVKESYHLLGRRLGCTVSRDVRSWHFRSKVRGVDTGRCQGTLPSGYGKRTGFSHSHRLATWHFCLLPELDHDETLQCDNNMCKSRLRHLDA
jgi:hypothetical protein